MLDLGGSGGGMSGGSLGGDPVRLTLPLLPAALTVAELMPLVVLEWWLGLLMDPVDAAALSVAVLDLLCRGDEDAAASGSSSNGSGSSLSSSMVEYTSE